MSVTNRDSQTEAVNFQYGGPTIISAFDEPPSRRATLRREKPKMAETWGEMIRAWPYNTFLIVLNEFCQKFASLSTILFLYLLNVLKMNAAQATIFMQIYQILGGIFPLFGSFLADCYVGKFKTIIYGSLLYGVGKILLSVASFLRSDSSFHPLLDYGGVLVIIVGMSGIIPCVASFGGDQFEPHQERMISVFFSIFYASINAGALISTILMPILRSQPCLDHDSCYPLSFGVSAIFMVVATVVFVVGSKWYKKNPPQGNVYSDLYHTIRVALRNKQYSDLERPHWLYYFLDTHDCQLNRKCLHMKRRKRDPNACERAKFLEDIRSLFRILVMYVPLPMFWALYDQQYSVWMIQAIQMDCRLWGDWLLLPDMMQFVNPVLILVFIFLFESIIYPIVAKFVKLTPLRKMVAGGVLASVAFVVSAQVQLKVNPTLPEMPQPGHAFVSFMNTFDHCNLTIKYGNKEAMLSANQSLVNNRLLNENQLFRVPTRENVSWTIEYMGEDCADEKLPKNMQFTLYEETIHFVAITSNGAFIAETDPRKPTGGTGEFSISMNVVLSDTDYVGNFALCRITTAHPEFPCNPQEPENFYFWQTDYDEGKSHDFIQSVPLLYDESDGQKYNSKKNASLYVHKHVRYGKWRLFYMYNRARSIGQRTLTKEEVQVESTGIDFEIEDQGGVYAMLLTGLKNKPEKRVFQVVPSNTVSILWQLPQIAIITAAEILFSITGYEFAYSQSGASMKSIMQAFWFLTVCIGDCIIIAVTLLDFPDMALQFNVYAGVMLVVIFIFALMSIFYYEYRVTVDDAGETGNDEDEYEELNGNTKMNGIPSLLGDGMDGMNSNNNNYLAKQYSPGLKNRKDGKNMGSENIGFQKDDTVWSAQI